MLKTFCNILDEISVSVPGIWNLLMPFFLLGVCIGYDAVISSSFTVSSKSKLNQNTFLYLCPNVCFVKCISDRKPETEGDGFAQANRKQT